MYDTRRILRDLADDDRRKRILRAFWEHADGSTKALAIAHLARVLHFREETLRKMPVEKKVELLGSRVGAPDFEQFIDVALMQYHTREQTEMLSAFLDLWNIPHEGGSIEVDDYKVPTRGQVRDAVHQLEAHFDRRDIVIYLATAGLLMEGEWQDSTWPVAEEMSRDS